MPIWKGYAREGLDVRDPEIEFFDVTQPPFRIYGLNDPKINFHRMPDETAAAVSGAVADKNRAPAGGRVRFATDSAAIAIRVELAHWEPSPHMTPLLATGFDLYADEDGGSRYLASYYPAMDDREGYEGVKNTGNGKLREYTLNLPLFNEVKKLYIGLKKGAVLTRHTDYRIENPVVFYGSSITHGAAATRPGNCYENFLARALDCNYRNFGFSGNAMGEPEMAAYIAGLEFSAFVLDYDYNAPDAAHLEKTHEPFYRAVRARHPDVPILMLSRPDGAGLADSPARREIILNTYRRAQQAGDNRVYFLDGSSFFPADCRNDCTVDGCHPNDLGFYFMAKQIGGLLKSLL